MRTRFRTGIKPIKEIGNNEYHKQYYAQLNFWAIEKLGGKCMRCGRTAKCQVCGEIHNSIFDIHHKDKTKSWTLAKHPTDAKYKEIIKWKHADKIPEDVKLFCATCHREVEDEIDSI